MTNGEKVQKDFNCEVCEPIFEDDIIHVIFADKKDSAIGFDWSWWSAEYKEPTTKNDLGVDCISREQALVAIRNLYPSMPRVDFNGSLRKWVDKYKPYIECDDAIEELSSVTPQEPRWTKCSENLPDMDVDVLGTIKGYGDVVKVTRWKTYVGDAGWEWVLTDDIEGNSYHPDEIIAWMPLPPCYEPQESEG